MLSSRPGPSAANSASTDSQHSSGVLGFDSLTALIAFGALLLLLLLGPNQLSDFWATTYNFWPQSIFLLLSAGVALFLAITPQSGRKLETTGWLLLAFLGWNALSIFTSVYKHDSYLEIARLSGAIAVYFVVRSLWRSDRALWIFAAWALGMAGVCLGPVRDFVLTHAGAPPGPFFNTNLFANALAMTLPVAAMLPVLVRRVNRSPFLVALTYLPFFACSACLVVTGSKGGFLAALIAMLVSLVLVLRAKKTVVKEIVRRNRLVLGVGGLIFLVLLAGIAVKTILPRLQQARSRDDNSTMFRVYAWRSTANMAKARPIFGHGPGSYPTVFARYAQAGYTRSAHESWLQIASDTGVPSLLLVFGAMGTGLLAGLKKLKSDDWPLVVGASGALVGLLVHGFFDSGWGVISITILFATALAILTSAGDAEPEPVESESRLNLFWISVTLLLALGGYQTQKAATGEVAQEDSEKAYRSGAPTLAMDKANEAVESDLGSARSWVNLGRLQEAMGGDGRKAFETAIALQPTRSANYANLARATDRLGGSKADVEQLYARAIEQNPLDTKLRLERAQWLLAHKDDEGYSDLERIVAEWNGPYGRYPALADWVNLDFARATVLLAPHLAKSGQTAKAKELIVHGLADCDNARAHQENNNAVLAVTSEVDLDANKDLDSVTSQLQALQTELK